MLCLVILATPLVTLVFIGMEHTLHLLVSVAFMYHAAMSVGASGRAGDRLAVLALAPALTAVRYEGLFLLGAVVALMLVRGMLAGSLAAAVLGALPVVLYGAVSVGEGWGFLPNPVLLKGGFTGPVSMPGIGAIAHSLRGGLTGELHLTALLVATVVMALLLIRKKPAGREPLIAASLVFVLTLAAHLAFARTGWFYRYDAYLVGMGLVTLSLLAVKAQSASTGAATGVGKAVVLIALVLLSPLVLRGASAIASTPTAVRNVYEQPYQVGLFLKEHYEGRTVALHDIGAPCFLAEFKLVDLYGLATPEVAQAVMGNRYDKAALGGICADAGVDVAVVYDRWDEVGYPDGWAKAGVWRITDRVSLVRSEVAFYAVKPGQKERLGRALDEFSPHLPPGVTRGLY